MISFLAFGGNAALEKWFFWQIELEQVCCSLFTIFLSYLMISQSGSVVKVLKNH